MQNAILGQLTGVSDCANVTDSHLAGITELIEWRFTSAQAIKSNDFAGLSALTDLELITDEISVLPKDIFEGLGSLEYLLISIGKLQSLPGDVFDGLDSLETLNLVNNQLGALPEDVFDGLSNLESLVLYRNQIDGLPEDVFDGFSSLRFLNLAVNRIDSLPEDVFDGLGSLYTLLLDGNRIDRLPSDVFDGLSLLERLELNSNRIAELPDGTFYGISNLRQFYLRPSPGAPFTFTAELQQHGNNAVVVKVAKGAPTDMSVTLSAEGGSLSTKTATVAARSTTSSPITVTPSGNGAVTANVVSAEFVGGLWGSQYFNQGHAQTGLGYSLTLDRVGGL